MKVCKHCNNIYENSRYEQYCSYDCQRFQREIDHKVYIAKSERIANLIYAIPQSNYTVDVDFKDLRDHFDRYAKSYGSFEYCPDFQRGHVWTEEQKIKYVEAYIRGCLGDTQKTIILNCPDFRDDVSEDCDLSGFCIVDGLQRVTAMLDFIDGKFKVFDFFTMSDFDRTRFSLVHQGFKISVFSFQKKSDLLKYYLAINSGGVVHSDDEINRVKGMLENLTNV